MSKTGATLCVALACCALAFLARGLDPERKLHESVLRNWGAGQGLPQASVEALSVATDGYLWIGTQEGLVRFDGFSFVPFDRSSGDPSAPHHVTTLVERRDGRLLVGSFGGAVTRNHSGFALVEGLEGFANHKVFSLVETAGGALWIGTSSGAAKLEGGRLTLYGLGEGLPSMIVRAVALDGKGGVWLGTDGGLVRVEGDRIVATAFPRIQVLSLAADADGMWIGTAEGLAHWTARGIEWHRAADGLPHPVVGRLLVDRSGALWAGTARGLGRLYRGQWSQLAPQQALASLQISALAEDHDGNVWIGSTPGGLSVLMDGQVGVIGTDDGLSNEIVYTLAGGAGGEVFAGAETGAVDRIEGGGDRITNIASAADVDLSRVRALVAEGSQSLWIGAERGLYHWNGKRTRKVTLSGLPEDSFRTGTVTRSGDLWFGTESRGAVRLSGGKVTVLDTRSGLPSDEVRAVLEDSAGNLWIGTYGGLVLWKDGIQKILTRQHGLAHDFVRCLFEDSEGALWVGTYGGGVSRVAHGRIDSFGTADGLVSDAVFAILEDGERNLWMSSNRGVFRVLRSGIESSLAGKRGRLSVLRLDEEDGMASAECNGGSPGGWKSPEGRLLFPTLRGVVVVDPTKLSSLTETPPTIIDTVSADGRLVDPHEAALLPPGTERVEIRFSAISLRSSRRIRFWHRLEGFDRNWVESGPGRAVQYTRLEPGRYVFRLTACAGVERCGGEGASFVFTIDPRLHQRAWFAPLVALAVISTLTLLWLWRMQRAAARERELQRRIQEALAQIKVLSGLIPICAGCKKIREDTGYWTLVEDYLRRYSDVEFSHGLCPDCVRSLYPEYADSVLARNGKTGTDGGEKPDAG